MSFVLVVPGNAVEVSYAPTLLEPENGSYEDLSGTPMFSWQYNPANPEDTSVYQTGFSFALIANGGATQYWNGSSFQSTPIWVSSTAEEVTFPDGAYTDGVPYQWAVATEDQNGQGPFSGYFTVNAQGIPTVVVTAPTGTIIYADPIITWSVTPAAGAAQVTYEVIIYSNAQYTAAGFEPGTGPSIFDTGVVGSAIANSLDLSKIPLYLSNTSQYRAYVQISQTGGQFSSWAYSAFTTNWNAPNPPAIVATATTDPTTGYPIVQLEVQGEDNLLPEQDSSPTTGLGTWQAVDNCTVDWSGSQGLIVSPEASGSFSAETATGAAGTPVLPNTEYTAVASFMASSVGSEESCTVGFAWYNASGTLISTSTGSPIIDITTGIGEQASVTATSPPQAAYAAVIVTIA